MYKRFLLINVIGILLLSGCGKQENAEISTVSSVQSEESIKVEQSVEGEQESASEVLQDEEREPEIYAEDTNVYGNTMGNISNDGLFLIDEENIAYLYNVYSGYTHKANISDGTAEAMLDMSITHLNRANGIIYGQYNELKNPGIVAYNIETNTYEFLRAGNVSYLQLVNGELYFTDEADHFLRKLNPKTKEETTLVAEPVYYPVVYKERIFFQLDSDGESLYSITIAGEELTKLNSIHSHYPIIYKDEIYYCDEEAGFCVRKMRLDGSEDVVWLETVSAEQLNIWGDVLYFCDANNPSVLSFVDLTSEEVVVQTLDFAEAIQAALKESFGESSVSSFEAKWIFNFNFSDAYICFFCNQIINETEYTDEYIYNRETGQIHIVTDLVYAGDQQAATEETKPPVEEEKEPEPVVTPGRSYPPGNYSVGSVYGPKLTQAELDQVADVVQVFLDSYDFSSMDDYTKVSTAHDYLCDNVSYAASWSQNRANTAWGALVYREAQCSGYARAMKALCDAMGVGCYYVHADENAMNPSHQWNEVCVDGNWYIIDVQCNDSSGFRAFFLVSGDTYASYAGMSWDRSSVPECPYDY